MRITMRSASLGDAALLLEWRNSPGTREFSQNSELIQIEEHMVWLSERLGRIKFEPFYVFELQHNLVGMSRLDFKSADEFEVSISVASVHHGKGIGTRILNMTCNSFFDLHPRYTITAKVHPNNLVSQKLFASTGFELQNPVGDFLSFKKTA